MIKENLDSSSKSSDVSAGTSVVGLPARRDEKCWLCNLVKYAAAMVGFVLAKDTVGMNTEDL